jgi:biopolymer transport protein ExbB/TolQ
MRHGLQSDLLFQFLALVISIIAVHSVYVTVVLPRAEAILADQRARQDAGEEYQGVNDVAIILKDPEQESEFVLAVWSLFIMSQKVRRALRERRLLGRQLLDLQSGTSVLPEDVREYARPLQEIAPPDRDYLVPRAMLAALQRFGSTRNIQDAAAAVKDLCESESDRLDSELSMVRYIIWAIPSIGFIGTVRGIGIALGEAQNAVKGDVLGVTAALGTAFNSTLVALLISVLIMLLAHQLQLLQERLVLDAQAYTERNLLSYFMAR